MASTVRIVLDKQTGVFTSLDYVTGRVILNLPAEESISTITVKLEGIARSSLPIPRIEGEREGLVKNEVEFHKLLHATEVVFPPPHLRKSGSGQHGFTITAGTHEYPFRVRLPINNHCVRPGLLQKYSMNFQKGQLDIAKDAQHIQTTLPPSLSGIPEDEAWIRYFVKATVNYTSFLKPNPRAVQFLVFLPIEPPRPPLTKAESYAKRTYAFAPELTIPERKKKKGFLDNFRSRSNDTVEPVGPPPQFTIETRLPQPPILVPGDPLPMRILINKINDYTSTVFLRSLQIRLRAYTQIRAHALTKTVSGLVPVFSKMELSYAIGQGSKFGEGEIEVEPGIWSAASLPETIAPSFRTCNITRFYEMEITIGVSNGPKGGINSIPLVMPVEVYSGITPSVDLVRAASTAVPHRRPPRHRPQIASGSKSTTESPVSPIAPALPQRAQTTLQSQDPEEPPPTYEEALAQDIGPVDGPRRSNFPQDQGYFTRLEDLEEESGKR